MSGNKVLCIGRPGVADPICAHLLSAGWEVHRAGDLLRAKRLLADKRFTVGVLAYAGVDDALCGQLNRFLAAHGSVEWVGCFDAGSLKCLACRDLILAHLFDHHTLPVDMARMTVCLGHAHGRASLRETPAVAEGTRSHATVLGQSPAIIELLRQVRRTASADAPVLIHGESGSGKELIAEAVHQQSPRAKGPFVPINCGAIQAGLIQSELFGHTGRVHGRSRREARGCSRSPMAARSSSTRSATCRSTSRSTCCASCRKERSAGSARPRCAISTFASSPRPTSTSQKAVAEGRFREDLFYRLNVLPLHVVPLRERREDIKLLAHHFFRKFSAEKSARLKGFSRLALMTMEAHNWPGNVRELINRVRCSMIMAEGKLIMPADLGLEAPTSPELQNVLDEARLKAERGAIYSSLQQTGRNVATSARQLGVSRMTLYRLMVKHGLNASQ